MILRIVLGIALILVGGLVVFLAYGAATDATDADSRTTISQAFNVMSVDRTEGVVQVDVASEETGIEFMTVPELEVGNQVYPGTWTTIDEAGLLRFMFDVPDTVDGEATVVVRSASQPVSDTATVALGQIEMTGPDGARYQIVGQELDLSENVVDIEYVIDTEGAPAISLASLTLAGNEIYAAAVGTSFDLEDRPYRGDLQFRIQPGWESSGLGGAVLNVFEFRRTVEVRLPVDIATS